MTRLCPCLALSLAACGVTPPERSADGQPGPCGALATATPSLSAQPPGRVLVLTTAHAFDTSSLDYFASSAPALMEQNRIVASGDAALRNLGGEAMVINRGQPGSVLRLARDVTVKAELGLVACNAHDAALLPNGYAVVTCYDSDSLYVLDLDQDKVLCTVSLAAHADADGIPEMDRLLVVGDRLYVTLQHLDREQFYTPAAQSVLVALATSTLEVVDAYPLPCSNPFTALVELGDGRLAVGCVGDFVTLSTQNVVTYDSQTDETAVLATGATLDGSPYALRASPSGMAHALVAVPDPATPYATLEMRVVQIDAGGVTSLHDSAGFSLSGLAFDAAGRLYVGNRSTGAGAGVWIIDTDTQGPYVTGLPPLEIEGF